jgi:L-fucose dehydrogenase
MRASLPFLIRSKGTIVNISSKVAITGQGGTSGYAAAKGAILGATREWAEEFAGNGIRVNAVVPAEVRTPQYEEWLKQFENPEDRLRAITARIPLEHRMTEPEEVAAMVLFLLSARSAGITGQQLFVDGGYVHLDRRLS